MTSAIVYKEMTKEIISDMYGKYGWVAKKGLITKQKERSIQLSWEMTKDVLKSMGFSYQNYVLDGNPPHVWTRR